MEFLLFWRGYSINVTISYQPERSLCAIIIHPNGHNYFFQRQIWFFSWPLLNSLRWECRFLPTLQFKKGPSVRSNEMFSPSIFCCWHLLEIRTGLVLIFKDCVCHFLFITICYPGAKQSQWHKTFTQVQKMVFEFNVGSFHHLSRSWDFNFSFYLFQLFQQIQIQLSCICSFCLA